MDCSDIRYSCIYVPDPKMDDANHPVMDGIIYNQNGEDRNHPNLDDFYYIQKVKTKVILVWMNMNYHVSL